MPATAIYFAQAHVDERLHLDRVSSTEERTSSVLRRLFLSAERSQTAADAILQHRHPSREGHFALIEGNRFASNLATGP